jgi:hypothetical protein
MVIVEEEGFVLVPFSFEVDDSWTGMTVGNRFDGKDDGIIGRSERVRGRAWTWVAWVRQLLANFSGLVRLTGCEPNSNDLALTFVPAMRLVSYETVHACVPR